jgi:hemoglobin-like flavoprotein
MQIQESLDRVLQNQGLLADQFYVLFLDRYPELRPYFHGVDMRRQALMLTVALMTVERHSLGRYPAAAIYLNYLGTRHSDRGVPREAYPKFRDALLETLARFHGKDWDPDLATQWGEALDRSWETMSAGYRERFPL